MSVYIIISGIVGVVIFLAYLLGKSKQKTKQAIEKIRSKEKALKHGRKITHDITYDDAKRKRVRDHFK